METVLAHINFVEFNSGDIEASRAFYKDVFDWNPQPWGGEDYLIERKGDDAGVDTGFATSQDGQPITVATISVEDIAGYMARVIVAGGEIVVPKFTIPGVGYGCYFTDTTGMIVGLHESDEEAAIS